MFGLKDDSITTVGVSCKGQGLYNLYCLGCASNLSSEASMLLHDWVSDTMKESAKKIHVMSGSYEFQAQLVFILFSGRRI